MKEKSRTNDAGPQTQPLLESAERQPAKQHLLAYWGGDARRATIASNKPPMPNDGSRCRDVRDHVGLVGVDGGSRTHGDTRS